MVERTRQSYSQVLRHQESVKRRITRSGETQQGLKRPLRAAVYVTSKLASSDKKNGDFDLYLFMEFGRHSHFILWLFFE